MKELEADVLLLKDKFETVCLSESDVYLSHVGPVLYCTWVLSCCAVCFCDCL